MGQLWNPDSPILYFTHSHVQISRNKREMLQKYPPPPHPEEDIHPSQGEIECLSPYLATMTTN